MLVSCSIKWGQTTFLSVTEMILRISLGYQTTNIYFRKLFAMRKPNERKFHKSESLYLSCQYRYIYLATIKENDVYSLHDEHISRRKFPPSLYLPQLDMIIKKKQLGKVCIRFRPIIIYVLLQNCLCRMYNNNGGITIHVCVNHQLLTKNEYLK